MVSSARAGALSAGAVAVNGKLEPLYSANVVPKMAGKIASINVDVGSAVAEGDILATLDAPELAALVDLYAAQLAKARESDLPAQKNQAEVNLANAEAALKTAEADYLRAKQLLEAGAVSPQQFEQQERAYKQAKANYEGAKNALDILVNATIPNTIRQCEAQLKKAEADYANSVVKSPVSGVVTARNANPGEMASPSQPLITVVALDPLVAKVSVGEEVINWLKVGQEVRVKIGAVREEPFVGKIANISSAADPQTKAYQVKIEIANPEGVLKPGMYAEVLFNVGREDAGIIIPQRAVVREGEKTYVWVVKDGVAVRREVVLGLADGKNCVVKGGLEEGEEMAVENLGSLAEGAPVKVMRREA